MSITSDGAIAAGKVAAENLALDPAQGSCPVPLPEVERVLLGHGSGGHLSAELLREVIVPALGAAAAVGPLEDAAVLPPLGAAELVMSTDSFVVHPRFFPGGDIGRLAVHGTVNDVAMRGGMPYALALAFIIEEGFGLAELRRIAASVGSAAAAAGVGVVTGDTKVVQRGAADGLFVTTTGIGHRLAGARVSAAAVRPGDSVLLSASIGAHGTTILSAREGLGFDSELTSDTRALHHLVKSIIDAGGERVHALRDPTRGGLASALGEVAQASQVGLVVSESAVPVPAPVAAACELLGLDPWQVANEGCLVAFVDPAATAAVLAAMRSRPEGEAAVQIGEATAAHPGRVVARTLIGAARTVDMLVGEQLPRIC